MVINKRYIVGFLLFMVCFIAGLVFFLLQKNKLIVYFNLKTKSSFQGVKNNYTNAFLRKEVKFFYWKDGGFSFEPANFVLLSGKAENIKHLVNNWLAFLLEERVLPKRVYVESVALCRWQQDAVFSFDTTFLNREWSIFKRWKIIESLFKTVQFAGFNLKTITFLVNNEQMEDDLLDFSLPWSTEDVVG